MGIWNKLKPVTLYNEYIDKVKVCQETIENCIVRPNQMPFSEKGDSGSLIFTNDNPNRRVLVGMLLGGVDDPRRTFTFFTHIQDIYEDIKSLTGASDVRFKLNRSVHS